MPEGEAFSKLLSKGLELEITDGLSNQGRTPSDSDTVIVFAKISKRPPAPKLRINYLIAADPTGETPGDWVLAEKNGTTAVKSDILIGVASGKTVDSSGWEKFNDGEKVGIPVKASGGKTAYLFKSTAKQDRTAYIPASKARKVSAVSSGKAPRYKVDTKSNLIKHKGNTYVKVGVDAAVLQSAKGEVTAAGTYTFWIGATAKKPASAKQTITLTS